MEWNIDESQDFRRMAVDSDKNWLNVRNVSKNRSIRTGTATRTGIAVIADPQTGSGFL